MRWTLKKTEPSKWKRWFAWYPVCLHDTGEVAWLETVWRRWVDQREGSNAYEYELDLGETRELPPERLRPHLQEVIFRAKKLGYPVITRIGGGGLDVWVHPDGHQEEVDRYRIAQVLAPYFKRTPETMGEAVCFKPEATNAQSSPV